jgi:chemotaxis response regulator CheB
MSAGNKSIRILAVDDHPLFRSGIAALLATQPDISLVAEASNGREAIEKFRAHQPDITLMDLQMPEMNGVDAMIAIRDEFPEARVIVLTTYVGARPGTARHEGRRSGLSLKKLVGSRTIGDNPGRSRRKKSALRRSLL